MAKEEDMRLAQQVVDRLNGLILDPNVLSLVETMIEDRTRIPDALVEHPTIQAVADQEYDALVDGHITFHSVGFLGLLNGICGVNEHQWGYVTACYDDASERLISFQCVDHQPGSLNEKA